MAASVEANYAMTFTVKETLSLAGDVSSKPEINHDGFATVKKLTGATTPAAVTKVSDDTFVMVAGAGVMDLTALPGTAGPVDLTGLKVQVLKLQALETNGNPIVLTFGAANPYLLFGAAWKITLEPGQIMMFDLIDKTPDVGPTSKNIGVSGTGTQGFRYRLVGG